MSKPSGSSFLRALTASLRARVPVLGWGIPGIGKTAMIEQVAADLGLALETVIGSIREPADYLGYPVASDGQLSFLPPDWARRCAERGSKNVVFFDEFNTASPSVFKAMLRVLQERYAGNQELPEDTAFIAAANPPTVAVDAQDLPAPLANRMLHLDWVFDPGLWHFGLVQGFDKVTRPSWVSMLGKGTSDDHVRSAATVSTFLNSMPQHLAPTPPLTLGVSTTTGRFAPSYAYPSPRSWHNLTRIMSHLRPDDQDALQLVTLGTVGEGVGSEFMAWFASAGMYDPRGVLNGTVSPSWSKDAPDVLFALMSAVTAIASAEGGKSVVGALRVVRECAEGGRKDAAVTALRSLLPMVRSGVQVPADDLDALRALYRDDVVI